MRLIRAFLSAIIFLSAVSTGVAADNNSTPGDGSPFILNPRIFAQAKYPTRPLKKGISGDVLLQFRLDEKGKPQNARVLLAEPEGAFEKHALFVVSKLRFSVPPEWVASHPNRVLDFGLSYVIDACKVRNVFPGIYSITIYSLSVDSTKDAYKLMGICKEMRDSGPAGNQPAQ